MDPKAKLCEQARDCHEDKVLAVPPTGAGESDIAYIILGTISGIEENKLETTILWGLCSVKSGFSINA